MTERASRRRVLATVGGIGGSLLTGCVDAASDDDGTVVVVNEDDEAHQVAVTLDRGSGYDTPAESLSLDAGERGQIRSFIPESDWNYPLLLHVEIDGEYVESTRHLGFDDVTLRITPAVGVENANPDDGPTVTPSDPHGPPTDA